MQIFVSWSGDKSRSVASALRHWIPDVMQNVRPWMSEMDIEAGAHWSSEISSRLGETKFGIICLTKANINAPWILFETGALAKTIVDTYVCPFLIDLEPSEVPLGPLTQFQFKRANEKETWELIHAINNSLKEGQLPEDKLKRSFERWWPDLDAALNQLPQEENREKQERSAKDLTEETLNIVRDISRRMPALKQKPFSVDDEWHVLTNAVNQLTSTTSSSRSQRLIQAFDSAIDHWKKSQSGSPVAHIFNDLLVLSDDPNDFDDSDPFADE